MRPRASVGLVALVALTACAPQTGLILEVQGPNGTGSVAAGIVELELITAHPSYCGRWVTDTTASGQRVSVLGRDLEGSPLSIRVTPDERTDLMQPVRATVLARDASGQLLGVASFESLRFTYEEVRKYKQRVTLLGAGARPEGPRYVTDDGCMCVPGRPWVGNSSGSGCDLRIPPSFARLVDTAGCELPPGAQLPIGICDGQLYPGERANRSLPCYVSRGGTCRIGQRSCNDENGIAFDRECTAADGAPAAPSGVLCDAFLACERSACGDPVACLKQTVPMHKKVSCVLPVAPAAVAGVGGPCAGGSWKLSGAPLLAPGCAAAMLDGTRAGALTLGWLRDGEVTASVASSLCPPTFVVEKIDIADPLKLPSELSFSVALDDGIYDVILHIKTECSGDANSPDNDLRCELN